MPADSIPGTGDAGQIAGLDRGIAGPGEGIIRPCSPAEFAEIGVIVNDAARRYAGVIPADCYHEPYMPSAELQAEIDAGVRFWGYAGGGGELLGVMGIQDVEDVTLIRHAYVRPSHQGRGIGGALLARLRALTERPILIGTWAAATWAVAFYEHHGFHRVTPAEKDRLLRRYWTISARQVETSVVLIERDTIGFPMIG